MRWLWLLVPLLSGCADAVWVPQVGLPWWQANELPADRVEGDCTVGFDAQLAHGTHTDPGNLYGGVGHQPCCVVEHGPHFQL